MMFFFFLKRRNNDVDCMSNNETYLVEHIIIKKEMHCYQLVCIISNTPSGWTSLLSSLRFIQVLVHLLKCQSNS